MSFENKESTLGTLCLLVFLDNIQVTVVYVGLFIISFSLSLPLLSLLANSIHFRHAQITSISRACYCFVSAHGGLTFQLE